MCTEQSLQLCEQIRTRHFVYRSSQSTQRKGNMKLAGDSGRVTSGCEAGRFVEQIYFGTMQERAGPPGDSAAKSRLSRCNEDLDLFDETCGRVEGVSSLRGNYAARRNQKSYERDEMAGDVVRNCSRLVTPDVSPVLKPGPLFPPQGTPQAESSERRGVHSPCQKYGIPSFLRRLDHHDTE